jgi:hypothetical protein
MNDGGPEVPDLSANEGKRFEDDLQVSRDAADVLEALAAADLHVGAGLDGKKRMADGNIDIDKNVKKRRGCVA